MGRNPKVKTNISSPKKKKPIQKKADKIDSIDDKK